MELITFVRESMFRRGNGPKLPLSMIDCGWGNGYAIIPIGHPSYGLNTEEIYEKYGDFIDISSELTWSESGLNCNWIELDLKYKTDKYWIIGFDTNHWGDTLKNWPKERVEHEANKLAVDMYMIFIAEERKNNKNLNHTI